MWKATWKWISLYHFLHHWFIAIIVVASNHVRLPYVIIENAIRLMTMNSIDSNLGSLNMVKPDLYNQQFIFSHPDKSAVLSVHAIDSRFAKND